MAHEPTKYEVEARSGRFVDVSRPQPESITLEDIAHALGHTCRYGGHCAYHYSVAEHAVFVSKRMERQGLSKQATLAGLHHDDSEAYLGDIPRPLKPLLGEAYEKMTDRMDWAIIWALDLPFPAEAFHWAEVKSADNWALLVEARFLLPSQGRGWTSVQAGQDGQPSKIVIPDYWQGGLPPKVAAELFIQRHKELTS